MKITEPENCTGCGACVDICPRNAVEIQQDDNGFPYTVIQEDKCVNCGLCQKVCTGEKNCAADTEQKYYILKANNEDLLRKSSSGGAFTAISDVVLEHGGCVYGCAFDADGMPIHIRAGEKPVRDLMRGSKYVQSTLIGIYRQVENDLRQGREVLFTGTPCQVDAIQRYLCIKKIDMENLITMDIICHGVPPRGVWKEYLADLEKRYHGKANQISFRTKKKGSNGQELTVIFDNGKCYIAPSGHDLFYDAFLRNLILCKNCFACKYCSWERSSDITVADYWGKEGLKTIQHDYLRESSLILNSEKGKRVFCEITGAYQVEQVEKERVMQHNLEHATRKPAVYDEFMRIKGSLFMKLWNVSSAKKRCLFLMNRFGLSGIYTRTKRKWGNK